METVSIKRLEKVKQLDEDRAFHEAVKVHIDIANKINAYTLRCIEETQTLFDKFTEKDLELMRKCFR